MEFRNQFAKLKLNEKVTILVGITVLLGFFYGLGKFIDSRYVHVPPFDALCKEVKSIERRLDYKILSDQYMELQKRIWTIEDRCSKRPCTDTEKEELRNITEQKKMIEKKLDKIIMDIETKEKGE